MPTATDLVTDLPADFEVFGQAVDTAMADLLGGTTGQILAKNSATNMDFVWITNDVGDITAVTAGTGITGGGTSGAVTITNDMATTITAAGDIVIGTGSGTYDNLPIGTSAQVLTADTTVSPYKVKWATPSSPSFKGCAATASYSPTPSASPFVISFASESFDTDAFHSTLTNTSRLTIPAGLGGYYQINAHYDAVSYNWGYSVGWLYVNGVKAGTTYGVDADQFARNNSSGNTININAILKLAVADYVELFAATDQTSAGTVKAFLQCTYLGA
jgi:hypothetical protein